MTHVIQQFPNLRVTGTAISLTRDAAGYIVSAGGGANSITLYATSNTTQSSTGTSPLSSLIFNGAGVVSVGISGGSVVISAPGAAASPVNFSAGTTSNNLGTVVFSNSNNVSFGLNGSTITGTISVPAQTTQPAVNALGVSNTGTTAGNTGTSSGITWVFGASGNITASQSTVGGGPNTIWYSVPSPAAQTTQPAVNALGVSNTGTTAGNTGTSSGITWVIAASGNITASESTVGGGPNTIWLSVPAAAGGTPASFWDNVYPVDGATTTVSVSGSTSYIAPFLLPYDVSASYLRFMVSASFNNTTTIATTNAATGSARMASTLWAMVYVQNTGASSQSLKSTYSASVGFTQQWSLSANNTAGSQWSLSKTLSFVNSTGATSFTTQSVASTSNINLASNDLTVMTGMKALDISFGSSIPAGNYWMMFGLSSASTTGGSGTLTRLNMSISNIAVTQVNNSASLGHWGNNTNASIPYMPGLGSFSTNAIGTTASLGFSNISTSASHVIPWFQFWRSA